MPQYGEKANIKQILFKDNTDTLIKQTKDTDAFNRALITDNRLFCEEIQDVSLKEKCKQQVINIQEINQEPEQSEQEIIDTDTYNRALITNDVAFCAQIQNTTLKQECETTITNQ